MSDDDDNTATNTRTTTTTTTSTTQQQPSITFTRKRTTTKTRTAASSARRRKNIPLVHAGGGGKDEHSWFARKSSGWTDDAIRSHLVSGGTSSQSGDNGGVSIVGDMIVGGHDGDYGVRKGRKKKKQQQQQQRRGVRFAWEEQEDEEDNDNGNQDEEEGANKVHGGEKSRRITAAPTIFDIMDEQDEIDFLAPVHVGKEYYGNSNTNINNMNEHDSDVRANNIINSNNKTNSTTNSEINNNNDDDDDDDATTTKKKKKQSSSKRRQNAALAELAQVSGGGGRNSNGVPAFCNESIGWRLLRVWGYRSRLGVAIVPVSSVRRKRRDAGSGNKDGKNEEEEEEEEIDEEELKQIMLETRNNNGENNGNNIGSNATAIHEAKWLARKGLRVIYLPSIHNNSNNIGSGDNDNGKDNNKNSNQYNGDKKQNSNNALLQKKTKSNVLTIPPPKLNKHGIEYDPFRNAPEFREFHERRRSMAMKRGRALDDETMGTTLGDGSIGKKRRGGGGGGGDKYYTDTLGKDAREGDRGNVRGLLWDGTNNNHDNDNNEDASEEEDGDGKGGYSANSKNQNAHYAATDHNYSDFIGTKASSGFALEDEDDANVYQDDEEEHAFGRVGKDDNGGIDTSRYALEVQSPLASEEEDNGDNMGGLFGRSASLGGTESLGKKSKEKRRENLNSKEEDSGNFADAWNAWGMGADSSKAATTNASSSKNANATMNFLDISSQRETTVDGKPPLSGFVLSQKKNFTSTTKRWKGPIPPTGFILKRHVFAPEINDYGDGTDDIMDCGLDLQARKQASRAHVPRLLPPSSGYQRQEEEEKGPPLDKMQLNFHAVRDSMKSRFVSSTETAFADDIQEKSDGKDEIDKDQKEWVQVTIMPWLPSRLLCKRWGVQFPSSGTVSTAAAAGKGGDERKSTGGEDEYFRQTVYEPAITANRQNDDDGELKKTAPRKKGATTSSDRNNDIGMFDACDEEEDAGPAPIRPSEEVFRAIFDTDSDNTLWSSDEENDLAHDIIDGNKGASNATAEDDAECTSELASHATHSIEKGNSKKSDESYAENPKSRSLESVTKQGNTRALSPKDGPTLKESSANGQLSKRNHRYDDTEDNTQEEREHSNLHRRSRRIYNSSSSEDDRSANKSEGQDSESSDIEKRKQRKKKYTQDPVSHSRRREKKRKKHRNKERKR